MKYLLSLFILLSLSCGPSKDDIVDEQKSVKKKINSIDVRLEGINGIQEGYVIAARKKHRVESGESQNVKQMEAEFENTMASLKAAEDSVAQWDPIKDSLINLKKDLESTYDSLEMELKKF